MEKKEKPKKEIEPGIIYLSRIPTRMSVKKVKDIFSAYGEIGRVFLQPDEKGGQFKKNRAFTEGWIEFQNKKIARGVAVTLNNCEVPGKRKNAWFQELWNIKYLPKFRWAHLNERQAYERQVHKQKLLTEVALAKRTTNFYFENVQRDEAMKRKQKRKTNSAELSDRGGRLISYRQKEPEFENNSSPKRRKIAPVNVIERASVSDIKHNDKKKAHKPYKISDNKSFLKKLFSGGVGKDS